VYILIDGDTNAIELLDGTTFGWLTYADPLPPTAWATIPVGHVLVGSPILYNGMTSIVERNFTYDMKPLLDSVGLVANLGDLLDVDVGAAANGWANASETWTRATDNTFTVAVDVTGKYHKGDKLRWKQGGGYKYAYIVATPTYSAPDTTVTISGGSNFVLTNGVAITDNDYSKVATPQGFPQWFNWTCVWSSAGTQPTLSNGSLVTRFCIVQNTVQASCGLVWGSSTNGGTGNWRFTLPLNSPAVASQWRPGSGYAEDLASAGYPCLPLFDTNSMMVVKSDGTQFSVDQPMTWATGDFMNLFINYEI
jgi:hypothetical protein